ncbi:hypothetical protein AVO44_20120 [Ruegeria profundi]|uniref:Uncharacterized protein n=1 Tax=Ruegeria profundi TaxID=1685378 RepID=A0A0X3TCV6_9RHOB|nr:hypothetical protein AVO44_20120 [Ruegeria profundi]
MQVPDLIRKYPFTGAAEAVVGSLETAGTHWRDGGTLGRDWGHLGNELGGRADVLAHWSGVWLLVLCSLTLMDN